MHFVYFEDYKTKTKHLIIYKIQSALPPKNNKAAISSPFLNIYKLRNYWVIDINVYKLMYIKLRQPSQCYHHSCNENIKLKHHTLAKCAVGHTLKQGMSVLYID